jgi:hypothetical protein
VLLAILQVAASAPVWAQQALAGGEVAEVPGLACVSVVHAQALPRAIRDVGALLAGGAVLVLDVSVAPPTVLADHKARGGEGVSDVADGGGGVAGLSDVEAGLAGGVLRTHIISVCSGHQEAGDNCRPHCSKGISGTPTDLLKAQANWLTTYIYISPSHIVLQPPNIPISFVGGRCYCRIWY